MNVAAGLPRLMLMLMLMLMLIGGYAHAHEVRPAYLQLQEVAPAEFEVLWKQPTLLDRRLAIGPLLPGGCTLVPTAAPEHTGAALVESWRTTCDLRSGELAISGLSATLTDVMVRIVYLNGDVVSQILRPANPRLDLADPRPAAAGYFLLGLEHLLLGPDHILFVVGLVLFIRAPWPLVQAVTAFTVAHSITLALSVLQLVTLPQGPVEAVIALSILFLARELMMPQAVRSPITRAAPWLMAFGFGLLHGFGFAGALADIGLPRDQLASSLLLFNLGIEAGQLGVIAVMLAIGWLVRRLWVRGQWLAERWVTVAMGCAAGFWTVDRVVVLL
ncbi:MAG: HupE/UreJ family protein [Pseudomonadales bacterium]